jgi:RNA polymerase sigma factor (TIGR02999 family)
MEEVLGRGKTTLWIDTMSEVTRILTAIEAGDQLASEKLLPLVYDQLRALAGSYFRSQKGAHTLEPTALVHEAFVRLIDRSGEGWADESHFLAVAAIAMRQILTDHARKRRAAKRGGGWRQIALSVVAGGESASDVDLVDLDDALTALAELEPRHARIIQMRFLGGMTISQVAEYLDVSTTTVDNDWRVARAWLNARLGGSES